jgi:CRP/FNR family transcriptional regulator, cyclic AMP receptor protein
VIDTLFISLFRRASGMLSHSFQSEKSCDGTTAKHPSRLRDASVLLFESLPQLAGVPDMFETLKADEIARVAASGDEIRFRVGDYLFRQGEPHRGIFIVREGAVRSFYSAPNGREITLANWTAGNFVGGPDIFGEAPHVWSGIGAETGVAIRLPGRAVQQLIADMPNFAIGLVQSLAYKGKCYSSLLQMLGTRSVVERLAHLLLNLSDLKGVRFGDVIVIAPVPSQEELAAMVGATRQWVSMTLEKFRKRGLIELAPKRLAVRQIAALRAIAEGR